jgi:hypothetical protein
MAEGAEQLEARIERIVRDVLASLEPRSTTSAAANASGASANGKATAATSAAAYQGRQVSLDCRVVTLDSLPEGLSGIREICVPRGALVTPAAVDALRAKGIRLTRSDGTKGGAGRLSGGVTVGVAACAAEPVTIGRIEQALARTVEPLARVGLVDVVREMGDLVALGGMRGILFTAETAAALCLANRRCGVRAITGRDAAEVHGAARSVGANVLVIRPDGLSTWQQLELARNFVNGSPRCPDEYCDALG